MKSKDNLAIIRFGHVELAKQQPRSFKRKGSKFKFQGNIMMKERLYLKN
jgi:hypothetical protein